MKEIERNHLYIGGVLLLYYIIWNAIEYFLGGYFNPSIQTVSNIAMFSVIVIFSHMVTHFLPCVHYAALRKLEIKKIFRLNSIKKQQLLLTLGIFITFNIMASVLIVTQDAILKNFGISFKMNDYIIADNLVAFFVLVGIIGILIPIGEELFYRGLLLRGMEGINPYFAIILSAIYFAIYHNNPHRLVTLFMFAVLFGLVTHYTRSIIPGIIMHILNNTVFVVYSYFQGKASATSQYNGLSELELLFLNSYWLLFVLFTISAILCVLLFNKLRGISDYPIKGDSPCLSLEEKKRGLLFIIPPFVISVALFILRASGVINMTY